LTALKSESVKPARVKECPVQMEARVRRVNHLGDDKLDQIGGRWRLKPKLCEVHVAKDLISRIGTSIRQIVATDLHKPRPSTADNSDRSKRAHL
jgi:flavin reductase (DIM6/NTAB) family NADH-FMN oxidoreductase RutF